RARKMPLETVIRPTPAWPTKVVLLLRTPMSVSLVTLSRPPVTQTVPVSPLKLPIRSDVRLLVPPAMVTVPPVRIKTRPADHVPLDTIICPERGPPPPRLLVPPETVSWPPVIHTVPV